MFKRKYQVVLIKFIEIFSELIALIIFACTPNLLTYSSVTWSGTPKLPLGCPVKYFGKVWYYTGLPRVSFGVPDQVTLL